MNKTKKQVTALYLVVDIIMFFLIFVIMKSANMLLNITAGSFSAQAINSIFLAIELFYLYVLTVTILGVFTCVVLKLRHLIGGLLATMSWGVFWFFEIGGVKSPFVEISIGASICITLLACQQLIKDYLVENRIIKDILEDVMRDKER